MKSVQFDRIARPYRWLEYLTFGPLLERCRFHFALHVASQKRALVVGDGDGRFLTHLYKHNPELCSDAVDISSKMLSLLRKRVMSLAGTQASLHTHVLDATKQLPEGNFDLVVTHFFFDCLTQNETENLIKRIASNTAPGALWLVSDFQIPQTKMSHFAQAMISSLYFGFHILCGLRVKQIPDYHSALLNAGFKLVDRKEFLMGILTTQLWKKRAEI